MTLSNTSDSRRLAVGCSVNNLTINTVQVTQNNFQKKVKLFCRLEIYFIYLRKNNGRRNRQVQGLFVA